MLRELWRSGRRRLRLHQVRRQWAPSPSPVFPTAIGESRSSTSGTICWWTACQRRSGWLAAATVNLGQIATNQWQANIYTNTFFDANGNGVRDASEEGLALVATNNRFRDGSYSNFNNTDLNGNAGFNEMFPLFSWYVIETDTTRYKNTGTHVVYDAGGPADGSTCGGTTGTRRAETPASPTILANTAEQIPVPATPAGTGRVSIAPLRTAPTASAPLDPTAT